MKFKNYLLNEMAFGKNDLEKVSKLLIKVLEKRTGTKFYPFGGEKGYFDQFKKSNGKSGIGYIYINSDGKLLRFNWEKGKKSSTITSIDYWENMGKETPDADLDIPPDFNIVQATHIVVDFFKSPFSIMEGRKPGPKKKEAAEKYGVDISLPSNEFWKQVRKERKKTGEMPKAKKGVKEVSTRSKQTEQAEKKFNNQNTAGPDIIFEDLSDLVQLVASGMQKSLVVTGMAGIGKTYTVVKDIEKLVGESGNDWVMMTGKSSPMGLYSTLFINRNKLIVFDDMDSVFDGQDTVNMLKGALDSTGDNTISWISRNTLDLSVLSKGERREYYRKVDNQLRQEALGETIDSKERLKLPSSFDFHGQVIFISNLSKNDIDPALLSRSFAIDITLSAQDVFKRMESILPKIMPKVSMEDKKEALDFLKATKLSKQANIRTLLNTIKCKVSGMERWQHLSEKYA